MPFVFTDGAAIGKPANILRGQLEADEVMTEMNGRDYVSAVRQWAAKKSPTAQRILNIIDNFSSPVYVVAMRGGRTCFDNDPSPGGVIYINLKLDPSVRASGVGVDGRWEKQHPFIAFLHECGHAVQNIENPLQFSNSAKGPLSLLSSDIASAATAHGSRVNKGKLYKDYREWYSRTGSFICQPWCVRLEYDNIYRHERQICMESGEPMRNFYLDYRID